MKTTIPEWFTALFRDLVVALQPRDLKPEACAVYYESLVQLGQSRLTKAAAVLKRRRFFPTTGEWYAEAMVADRLAVDDVPERPLCPRCRNKGLIAIWYHDGSPFDLAICDCVAGQRFRRIGVEGVERFIATPLGGRIRLTDENRIGLIEDFA